MSLDGTWLVQAAGTSLFMRALMWVLGRNVKVIQGNGGYNESENLGDWGWFDIKYWSGGIKFIYRTGGIVDTLKRISEDKLLGELYLFWQYVGRFTMERVKE